MLDVQSIGPGQTMDLVFDGGAGEGITSDPDNPAGWGPGRSRRPVGPRRPTRPGRARGHPLEQRRPDLPLPPLPALRPGLLGRAARLRQAAPRRPRPAGRRTCRAPTRTRPRCSRWRCCPTSTSRRPPPHGHEVSVTPLPDLMHPGYPLMLKGEYGQRAYRRPARWSSDRYGDPAPQLAPPRRHRARLRQPGHLGPRARQHGHPASRTAKPARRTWLVLPRPVPAGAPVREYHPTAIDAKIVYNKAGWNDPGGKLYVEAPPCGPPRPDDLASTSPPAIRDKHPAGSVLSPSRTTCAHVSASA